VAKVLKRCDCDRQSWSKCPHSWTVRWWGIDGRTHEKSFKRNHSLASNYARQVEAEKLSIHRGDPPSPRPSDITLQSYAEQWLSGLTTPNTVRAYGSALRNHVLPQHGHRPLAEVAADREGMQALLRSVPPGMSRVTLTALRSMLTEAKAAGRITEDRLTGLRTGDLAPLAFTFPDHGQLTRLAEQMRELAPAIWIMRGCGLRPAEVLAVRGEAFSGGRLRVSGQQLADGSLAPLKARRPGDFRDVPVPGYVAAAVSGPGGGYLFSVPSRTFSGRFRKAADAAGLKGFRAHDLRHVFASVALSAGVPVTDVSRWLGHRSIEMTYRIYSHYIPSSFDRAIEVLDAEYQDWSAGGVLREP
jgi:integrase